MRIKHPKDPKNIFWTRDNGDIQYDNHAKHGPKYIQQLMSANIYAKHTSTHSTSTNHAMMQHTQC